MRTTFIALLVALVIMLQMMGHSDAAPQPEPVAAPWPNPFPYVWQTILNIPDAAMGVFKASSENKEAECTTTAPTT